MLPSLAAACRNESPRQCLSARTSLCAKRSTWSAAVRSSPPRALDGAPAAPAASCAPMLFCPPLLLLPLPLLSGVGGCVDG